MLMGQQEACRQRIVDVEFMGGQGHFSCCLMPNDAKLIHVTMSFEKLNERIVQGTIIPQLTITGCEELAKILETIFDLPTSAYSLPMKTRVFLVAIVPLSFRWAIKIAISLG